MEAFFRRTIIRGQKRGDIDTNLDAATTAKSLVAQVVGMHVLSRGTFNMSDLHMIKDHALRLIT